MTEKDKQEIRSKHLSPIKTIRAYCLHCVGGSAPDVRACDANDPKYHVCPFHSYRLGKGRPSVKTIRKFCLQCMGNYVDFVFDCETTDCLCYPYRMGKNPAKIGKGHFAIQAREKEGSKKHIQGGFKKTLERSPLDPILTLPRGEIKNLSAKSAYSENSSLGDQFPDPSLGKEARKKGRELMKGEQISLFSPEGIPSPSPKEKSEKQTTGKGA